MNERVLMERWWNGTRKEQPQYPEKNRSDATVPTANPTWSGRGLGPVIRGEKSPTIRLTDDMPAAQ
jgi:hypothetical protein